MTTPVSFTLSDSTNITLTLVPGPTVAASIVLPGTATIEPPQVQNIDVFLPGPQGPSGSPNMVVSSVNPNLTEPGLWIETGLGSDGTGFTFWIEDGV
jgi:hypothetical protein